jgi:hypothetical protein
MQRTNIINHLGIARAILPRTVARGLLRVISMALIFTALISWLAFSHGNFDHVAGTVTKTGNQTITVQTAKGEVDIKLTPKTEITKEARRFSAAEIKPGMRVVIDVPRGSKEAHSVKVGVQTGH